MASSALNNSTSRWILWAMPDSAKVTSSPIDTLLAARPGPDAMPFMASCRASVDPCRKATWSETRTLAGTWIARLAPSATATRPPSVLAAIAPPANFKVPALMAVEPP